MDRTEKDSVVVREQADGLKEKKDYLRDIIFRKMKEQPSLFDYLWDVEEQEDKDKDEKDKDKDQFLFLSILLMFVEIVDEAVKKSEKVIYELEKIKIARMMHEDFLKRMAEEIRNSPNKSYAILRHDILDRYIDGAKSVIITYHGKDEYQDVIGKVQKHMNDTISKTVYATLSNAKMDDDEKMMIYRTITSRMDEIPMSIRDKSIITATMLKYMEKTNIGDDVTKDMVTSCAVNLMYKTNNKDDIEPLLKSDRLRKYVEMRMAELDKIATKKGDIKIDEGKRRNGVMGMVR